MVESVASRYATITMIEPQNRYVLIEPSLLTSTPMFSGTSMPSNARKAKANTVTFE